MNFPNSYRRWRLRGNRLQTPFSRLSITLFALLGFLSISKAAPSLDESSTKALQELNQWLVQPPAMRPEATPFIDVPLTKANAAKAMEELWRDHLKQIRATPSRVEELRKKEIELDGLQMKFDWLSFGDTNTPPTNGRSLFISMHGGGGAPKAVNDQQWTNQIRLGFKYKPDEGIYVAPRAPTDAWNMWHQSHIDDFFGRLIEDFMVFKDVNPNRVYLMGYSAGGDGVYQLAPRMADRWAAAAMMAGHPNDASPIGLRNVPFAIQVGANDSAYHRNEVAAEWGKKLDALELYDPQGYRHFTKLYAGKGHWMDLQDRRAIPWMEKFTRDPIPAKLAWHQDDVTHTRFYWLERPKDEVAAGQEIFAERSGQVISLSSTNVKTVTVLLNDAMLDLDKPVVIQADGQILYSNVPGRFISCIEKTIADYGDPDLVFSSEVTVTLPSKPHWWSAATEQALLDAGTNQLQLVQALETVSVKQRDGMQFLMGNMPLPDRENLTADYLLTNSALAHEAMATAPWSKEIPTNIFLNDILPYAVVNEVRDDWRSRLRKDSLPLIQSCRTPGEAALALNKKLFDLVKVHYSTERQRADQSPQQSMASGLASCTGLTILLVDACRSVGVPARLAGTPMWMNGRGNHSWVEIWDGGWHFVGASEPDAAGLDHAWFVADAAQAQEDQPEHAIYASSFARTGLSFPLDWAPDIDWISAVNVTGRYAKKPSNNSETVRLMVKVLDASGQRVNAAVTAFDPAKPDQKIQGESRNETADMNNIFSFKWPANSQCEISAESNGHDAHKTVTTQANGEQVVVIQL